MKLTYAVTLLLCANAAKLAEQVEDEALEQVEQVDQEDQSLEQLDQEDESLEQLDAEAEVDAESTSKVGPKLVGVKLLGAAGCNKKHKCNAGETDCDHDSDCKPGLKCMQKNTNFYQVPGVYGQMKYGGTWDFCYNPNWLGLQNLNDKGWSGCSKSKPCDVGEGDCDNDSECKGRLKCLQLNKKHSVPGVYMENNKQPQLDVCYDPLYTKTRLSPATNRGADYCTYKNKCQVGEGDCDRDSDCAKGLKCYQRQQGETVPGLDGLGLVPYNYDFCYDPKWAGLNVAYNRGNGKGWNICSSKHTCGVGQGECDRDSDCLGSLKCFQREHGETVPGVTAMDKYFAKNWDVCYDPKWRGQMPASKATCGPKNTCGIGQGSCKTNKDCLGHLKCSNGGTKVRGVEFEEGMPVYPVCFDPSMPFA